MALDIYYKQDILNVLRALCVAGQGPPIPAAQEMECAETTAIYRQGYLTALTAVALAFGLGTQAQSPTVGEQSVHLDHPFPNILTRQSL